MYGAAAGAPEAADCDHRASVPEFPMPDRVRFPAHIQLTTEAALDLLAPLEVVRDQLLELGQVHAAFELDQAAELLREQLFQTE